MKGYNSGYELGKHHQIIVGVTANNVGCHQVILPTTYSPNDEHVKSRREDERKDKSRTVRGILEDKSENSKEDG